MKLLDTCVLIDIDRGGSEVLPKVRSYQNGSKKYEEAMEVDIMDTYIASTAILHRLTLVTANIAHFEEIDKLKVKQW